MKKTYQQPTMEIITIRLQKPMLAGSGLENTPTTPGIDSSGAPQYIDFDDEDFEDPDFSY